MGHLSTDAQAMQEFAVILVSSILINNFVLVQFLGLCPFMGVSTKLESAIGMSAATTFVLTLTAMASYVVDVLVLMPLGLIYLRTIAFILVIAAVELTDFGIGYVGRQALVKSHQQFI